MRPPAWLPNAISGLRLLLLPVWAAAVYGFGPFGMAPNRGWAVGLLIALGVSDVVDGALARRFGLQSQLGAMLDAAADKAAQVLVFTLLAFAPPSGFYPVPIGFVVLLVLRDLILVVGLLLIWRRRRELAVEHQTHGKVVSVALFGLMLWVHAPVTAGHPPAMIAVAGLVVISAVFYIRDGFRVLRTPTPS